MALHPEHYRILENFVQTSNFKKGFLELDLDGTVLLEERGRVFIDGAVERAIKKIDDLGRPVVLNTLRFPRSVMWTVGKEWFQMSDTSIPTVLLNGSLIGFIHQSVTGLVYEEVAAFPLELAEILGLIKGIHELLHNNIHDIILFYYPRDWRVGEIIWTPDPSRIEGLRKKYLSASDVISVPTERLKELLQESEVLMASLIIDRPEDTLMAYQHSKRNEFFTHEGIDKAYGMRELAKRLSVSPVDSFGAGDTEMDSFLSELGLAIIIGGAELPYKGVKATARLNNPFELGEFIGAFADLVNQKQI